MAVGNGAVTTGTLNNASTTTTVSFVSTDQPVYCIVPAWFPTTINGVTYGGTALTRVAQSALSSGSDRVEIWRLLTPTAGTANLVITCASTNLSGTCAIFNTTGQHTGTPEGTPNSAVGTSGTTTGSLALTGAAVGDLTIAGVAGGGGVAATPAASGGSGLTEIMDVIAAGEGSEAFTVADAVTTVSATFAAENWAIAAITLKSAVPPPPAGVQAGTPTWSFPHPPMRVA